MLTRDKNMFRILQVCISWVRQKRNDEILVTKEIENKPLLQNFC